MRWRACWRPGGCRPSATTRRDGAREASGEETLFRDAEVTRRDDRPAARVLRAAIAFALIAVAPRSAAQAPASHHAARATVISPSDSAAEAEFLAAARTGTVRYRDLAQARLDGYRPLGGDLPSLGEHWVSNRRALADSLDPAAPSILVYVRVRGEPVLAGVAYTKFLAPGAPLPEFPRSQPRAWHEHNGGVEDEVLPLAHHGAQPAAPPGVRLRIAVMHAWIGVPNPAGIWESENWGLPYARLGLAPETASGGIDARVLSLATGADYYLRAVVSVGELDPEEARRAERILSDYASRAGTLARMSSAGRVAAADALWASFWDDIAVTVRPEASAKLMLLRGALGGDVERGLMK